MKTFAQNQKQSQQQSSTELTRPNRVVPAASHQASAVLHLQRTIGNQAALRLPGAEAEGLDAISRAEASANFAHDFSRIPLHAPAPITIQPKLTINTPGDIYEQEADHVAEQVMRMPEPNIEGGRACGGGCSACQSGTKGNGHQSLQTKHVGPSDAGQIAAPPIVHEVLASPGQPLDSSTRAFFEPRFGHDFSRVRVHTGENAPASAKAVGALAYTYGSDVIFGAGQFSPHTWEGRRLLAHELAHVVQQQSFSSATAVANNNTAAEVEAGPAAAGAAHGGDVAAIRGKHSDVIQLQPDSNLKPTKPTLIKERDAVTKRIDDAYGGGSLSETQWRNLLGSAEQAMAAGNTEAAKRAYLTLYSDIAKLAQATLVMPPSRGINVVTGSKTDCHDAKPGLNLSLQSQSGWGANATTAFVDAQGKFGVKLNARGVAQPEVATVLTRSAFKREKEQTLATLRHEMIHAEHDNEDAVKALRSDPRDRSAPDVTSRANSELLAYVEGFMTMFHLTNPAPTSSNDPAFVQLLGVLDVGKAEVLPWAEADPTVRSEASGRLQEYYCHALDWPHRRAFDDWVAAQLVSARRDEIISGVDSPGPDEGELIERRTGADVLGATIRVKRLPGSFFRSLQSIITGRCKGISTPMALPTAKRP
jgi:hypothetical protein